MENSIKVVEGPLIEGRIPTVVGSMSVIHILRNFEIPEWDQETKEGYQREANKRRVSQLAESLHQGRADLPTAILINRRNITEKDLLKDKGGFHLPLPKNKNDKFFIIDGQHRVKALKQLKEEHDDNTWMNHQLPFVCLLGANEEDEMKHFHIVNSTAKSVKTDLTYALLKKRAQTESNLEEYLTREKLDWMLEAQSIAEKLDKTEIWKGLIRFPNTKTKGAIIGSAAIVNSLRGSLSEGSSFIQPRFKTEDRVEILDALWKGIRIIFEEAFTDNPKNYAIQKTVGVYVLHALIPSVLINIVMDGKDPADPQEYANILKPALEKLGAENSEGEIVEGIDFWRAGYEGAAGQFSSEQGRNIITKRIKNALNV